MEKSNTALRKELVEAKSAVESLEGRAKDAEGKAKAAESTLALEREMTKLEVDSYNEALENLRKEKAKQIEQLEGIAFEAMMKERCSLMRQFSAGEHASWAPTKWIQEYERMEAGLPLSSDEESDGDRQASGDVDDKGVGNGVEQAEGKNDGDSVHSTD